MCALVERIYLVIVSREGNRARFELLSKIFESFNVMGCIPPPVCLWACKERYNLCMNRASLDRESCIPNEAQYDLDRKAAKTSALSYNNLDKYEYLNGEDLGLRPNTVKQTKFEYFPLGKSFNKVLNEDDQKEGLFKRL